MISRFLRWLARAEIEKAVAACGRETAALVDEQWAAKVVAAQAEGYHIGLAHGQRIGAAQMSEQIERIVGERHDPFPEITAEDIARARKGMVH